ncbi:microsomal glutathione S-transferase 1 isoform X2 [Manis javanica]|uniref:microsomal glutathione S-transferase 1 isoform X2 n=1 Tax=Manis javanica TaxID=9974 RepID=UPI003C6D5C64
MRLRGGARPGREALFKRSRRSVENWPRAAQAASRPPADSPAAPGARSDSQPSARSDSQLLLTQKTVQSLAKEKRSRSTFGQTTEWNVHEEKFADSCSSVVAGVCYHVHGKEQERKWKCVSAFSEFCMTHRCQHAIGQRKMYV